MPVLPIENLRIALEGGQDHGASWVPASKTRTAERTASTFTASGGIVAVLDGEGMSDVCREFGISRKTGYKLFNRYKDHGLEALTDRSRRPVRYANQLPDQIERTIVAAKKDKPHWGARKIRELLVRKLAGDVRVPAKSTVHAVLDRHGLVQRARQRRRCKAEGTALSLAAAPNDLWCADRQVKPDGMLQGRVQAR